MLIDGIDLLEGSIVENLTIDSGDGTAQSALSPSNGEMFYRTDLNEFQVYINGSWNTIGTQGDLASKVDVAGDTMSGPLSLSHTAPQINFERTGEGTDEKIYDILIQTGGQFLLRTRNDSDIVGSTVLEVNRTGTTVDSVNFPNGNVGIGTSSPQHQLHVHEPTTGQVYLKVTNGTTGINSTTDGFDIGFSAAEEAIVWNRENTDLRFATNNSERMRIDTSGNLLVGRTSTVNGARFMAESAVSNFVGRFYNSHATNPEGIIVQFTGDAPDNNTERFLQCFDTGAVRLRIYSDGDVVNHDNSYGSISDISFKQDISLAGSQWDDIKNIGNIVSKFRMKTDVEADENAPYKLGVIAQDLEQISPGLVVDHPATDEDEEHKSVKYSILYMKAVKALGEALDKIDNQQATIDDLIARIEALESK